MHNKCIVCGADQKNGAMCHSFFNNSSLFFYCVDCLRNELEPYPFLLEWAKQEINFPETSQTRHLILLNKNLKYYKKTFEDFLKDLDKTI